MTSQATWMQLMGKAGCCLPLSSASPGACKFNRVAHGIYDSDSLLIRICACRDGYMPGLPCDSVK